MDKRTDIWAFGCVLYEMLTGKRAFQGEDVTDTLAAVLRAEPAWLRLPHNLPEAVQTLLRRCLTKDPSHRLRDIGDARFDFDAADPARSHESTPRRRASSRTWTVSALAAVLGLAFGLGLTWRMERPAPSPGGAVISFDVTTPVSADPSRLRVVARWPTACFSRLIRNSGCADWTRTSHSR